MRYPAVSTSDRPCGPAPSPRRGPHTRTGAGLVALALAGCGLVDTDAATPEATSQIDEPLYGFGSVSRRWPNGIVPVCWQDPDNFLQQHDFVRQVVTNTWSAAGDITFKGWGACSSILGAVNHLEIAISTVRGYRANATGLGYGRPVITLAFDDWGPDLSRFRAATIHEFGHILGFPHEMRRPDNWVGTTAVWCGVTPSNSDYPQYSSQPGGVYLTQNYDVNSVMNYYYVGDNTGPGCNPIVNQQQLSRGDVEGLQRPEAYGPPRAHIPTELLVAPRYLGQNGDGEPRGLRIESLLPAPNPSHPWSFVAQDLEPTYAINNMKNWKPIGDLNSDGLPDLVAPIYLGPPRPSDPTRRPPRGPGASGLRIATALSAGPGSWTFTAQDIAPDYDRDDATNWKVAGDLNGDGRPDLFDTVYLGPPGGSELSGLRIQTALSTGPGTWVFASQDVAADYATDDPTHWIAGGDINRDGRPDLFNTTYLPPDSDGNPTGLRVYNAFSTGPGTWNVTSQDILRSFVPDDLGNWHPAVLNASGRRDFINFHPLEGEFEQVLTFRLLSSATGRWSLEIGSVGTTGSGTNIASWRTGDFNGDGFTDVVSPAILAAGTGLRLRFGLYATFFGTGFATNFYDVDPSYTIDDTTQWQVMDIDGDRVDDLVNVASLGPTGGLRIKALVSHGDGTWTLTTREVVPGDSASAPTGWLVAGSPN